jgi:hypothetical protein
MRELTQKGIDVNRNPFAPYSEQYLKQLNREGKINNSRFILYW